uniref:Peptidoglycan binding domain-containing protein n=1 Tax=uncultured Thiotrichaceae bacterium TaxID=298394 RepID=A0A6S6TZS4_9GAMM|nr:MAG: Putative peptidoglycan binding domain-containing protein [uncultured Thiotrichaceae bacterium]
MTTMTRTAFLQEMSNKNINIAIAARDPRLSELDMRGLDQNNTGFISGRVEMNLLFTALDDFDVNGTRTSIDIGQPANPTKVGKIVIALRELATTNTTNPSGQLKDNALFSAFPDGLRGELKHGDRGQKVVAIQYTLGRLGHLHDLCDGKFGGLTEQAIKSFQSSRSLSATGTITPALLSTLDSTVTTLDLRTPAQKAADPLIYLSGFRRLRLPEIRIRSTSETFSWNAPEIQRAYGEFVGHYWEVMKSNRIEGDCKNIALFLMDQFRKQIKEDRFIDLPHPVLGNNEGSRKWIIATEDKTRGLFSRADRLRNNNGIRVRRPGYNAMLNIQKLDPQHSMLYGVNVHYPQLSAHQVAHSTTRLFNWNPALSNHGDPSKPEVPVDKLQPGNMIFIDHSGDQRYDHTVTVIKVERDSGNHTRKLVLAVGSYDDARDNSAATSVEGVGLSIVNTYSEEVTVTLDTNGRITQSDVTYSSEPDYLVNSRYSARTTLMEQRSGGTLFVARWG